MAEGGPTAKPKDLHPSVDRIEELARRVLSGDILLPKFQREFVWKRQQILDLLDSISKNYPIGSILLWHSRQELRNERNIADLDVDIPRPDYPVNYLLDGQQRLSTVCGAMFWKGTDPKSVWNIIFDLRTQKFEHTETLDPLPPTQVRLHLLATPSDFYRHISSLTSSDILDRKVLVERADALFNRFKDYKVSTVTLGDMSIDDVAPIFERINSTGTSLTVVDLIRAATWSTDFDLFEATKKLKDELSDYGYGNIDDKAILRTQNAACGDGFAVDNKMEKIRKKSPQELKEISEQCAVGWKLAVDFLRQQIGCPYAESVPYLNQMVILCELFRRQPNPTSKQLTEMKRWFWSTSATGHFAGWSTGDMARDLTGIERFLSGEVEHLTYPEEVPSARLWKSSQFRANSALSRTFALLLAGANPKDLLNCSKNIDISKSLTWQNHREFHHFFPKAWLESNRICGSDEANCIANFVLLTSSSNKEISDSSPMDYLMRVKAKAGNGYNALMESNLIPQAALKAAESNDFRSFIDICAEFISEKIALLMKIN